MLQEPKNPIHKKTLALLLGLFLILGVIVAISSTVRGPSDSVSEDTADVRNVEAVAMEFGKQLKMVSLLAPREQVESDMDAYYAQYVTPELLAAWKTDLTTAPGKLTSSPYPDSLAVTSTTENTDGSYTVVGSVTEVTSARETPPNAYTVTLRIERRGEEWRIAQYTKGAYTEVVSTRRTVEGTYVCLPHRNTDGPQTMECAFGLQESVTGLYYALDARVLATDELMTLPTGTMIRVEGLFTPVEMLSSDMWQKYNITGIVSVSSVTRL